MRGSDSVSIQRSAISYQPTPSWPVFFRLRWVQLALRDRPDPGDSPDCKQLAREVTEVKRMLTSFIEKLKADI